MATEPRKRFSMIREFHFADWFTLGNAVCGTGALFSSMTYLQTGHPARIYAACALPVVVICRPSLALEPLAVGA